MVEYAELPQVSTAVVVDEEQEDTADDFDEEQEDMADDFDPSPPSPPYRQVSSDSW